MGNYWNEWKEICVSIATTFVFVFAACLGIYTICGGFASDAGLYMQTVVSYSDSLGIEYVYSVKMDRSLGDDRTLFKSMNKDEAVSFFDSMK